MSIIKKACSENGDNASLSNTDDSTCISIHVQAKYTIDDVVLRFERAAKDAICAVQRVSGPYGFKPIVVASDVDGSILNNFCTAVDGYHIHVHVIDGKLFIFNVSTAYPHAGGVGSLISQASNWSSQGRISWYSAANTQFGRAASGVPDMTLSVKKRNALPGGERRSAVIIEIEVSNRSILDMRRDFLPYFGDDSLLGVVGLKFFGPAECPAQRAVAVYWVRTNEGVQVSTVRDFGFIPISNHDMQVFAQDVDGVPGELLPGVDSARWALHRHVPLAREVFVLVPQTLTPRLCAKYIHQQDDDRRLYASSTVPIITIPGAALQSIFHNPPNDAEPLDDFNLNLGNVLFRVMQGAEIVA